MLKTVRSTYAICSMGLLTWFWASYVVVLYFFVRNTDFVESVIQRWSAGLVKKANIQFQVKGREKVPDEGALYVFNHSSLLDIPVIHQVVPRPIRFGSKKELFRIPFFGAAMKVCGILMIDRKNRAATIRTYKKAQERFLSGESFVLAAEGTRQVKKEIAAFKSGPFVLAIEAKTKIVPVVLNGFHDVLAKGDLLIDSSIERKVYVEILDPIDASAFSFETRNELKSIIREKMISAFSKNSKHF